MVIVKRKRAAGSLIVTSHKKLILYLRFGESKRTPKKLEANLTYVNYRSLLVSTALAGQKNDLGGMDYLNVLSENSRRSSTS
jgi:hypothetical protein